MVFGTARRGSFTGQLCSCDMTGYMDKIMYYIAGAALYVIHVQCCYYTVLVLEVVMYSEKKTEKFWSKTSKPCIFEFTMAQGV